MQLRVPRPRGPVHERRRQNSLGVDLAHPGLAFAAERRVVLQMRQPGRHRRSVALTYRHADLATGGRPQRRHRLRRRERQIPARHPIGALPHPIRLPERLPRHRMAAIEQTRQLLGGHLAPQTRGGRAPPHPSPGRLAPARVVILQPDGDRVRVVRHGRSGHFPPAQHRPPPTRRRAAGTTTQLPAPQGANVRAGSRARRSRRSVFRTSAFLGLAGSGLLGCTPGDRRVTDGPRSCVEQRCLRRRAAPPSCASPPKRPLGPSPERLGRSRRQQRRQRALPRTLGPPVLGPPPTRSEPASRKRLASSRRSSCPTFRTRDGGTVMSIPHARLGCPRSPAASEWTGQRGLRADPRRPAACRNGYDGLVYVTAEALEEFQRLHAPTPH